MAKEPLNDEFFKYVGKAYGIRPGLGVPIHRLGQTQATELRRAFMAGAWTVYTLMMSTQDPPKLVDLELMEAMIAELEAFPGKVEKGEA